MIYTSSKIFHFRLLKKNSQEYPCITYLTIRSTLRFFFLNQVTLIFSTNIKFSSNFYVIIMLTALSSSLGWQVALPLVTPPLSPLAGMVISQPGSAPAWGWWCGGGAALLARCAPQSSLDVRSIHFALNQAFLYTFQFFKQKDCLFVLTWGPADVIT